MRIGELTENQLLDPKVRTCYNDIIRKNRCIIHKIDIIESVHKNLLNNFSEVSGDYSNILSGEISDCFGKIYSCMEYMAIILKEMLREKGNLTPKFYRLLKKTIENTDPFSIYADKRIVNLVGRTLDWYPVVHDIRSEETHYSMGKIKTIDSKIFYVVKRQTNRDTADDLICIAKGLSPKRDVEYILGIGDITKIHLGFVGSIREMEAIILSKESQG